jgi:transcription antitermination factor NusG
MSRNWYAVFTKPKCEKRFCSFLQKKKIEHFCPLNKISKNEDGDSIKPNNEPLFTSFVFVNIEESQMGFIKQQSDVINFMYWLGRPIHIRGIEIESIQEFSAAHDNIILEKTDISSQKMSRLVTKKPVMKNDQDVLIMSQTEVRLTLPTLGFSLIAVSDQVLYATEDNMIRQKMMVS